MNISRRLDSFLSIQNTIIEKIHIFPSFFPVTEELLTWIYIIYLCNAVFHFWSFKICFNKLYLSSEHLTFIWTSFSFVFSYLYICLFFIWLHYCNFFGRICWIFRPLYKLCSDFFFPFRGHRCSRNKKCVECAAALSGFDAVCSKN